MPERETIVAAIEPVLATLGLEVFDVQLTGSGRAARFASSSIATAASTSTTITAASERIQPALDDLGPYLLEVSSPGLERPLRTPAHFRRRGRRDRLREGPRRRRPTTRRAAPRRARRRRRPRCHRRRRRRPHRTLAYDDIIQARTVFEWGAGAASRGQVARSSGADRRKVRRR